MFVETSSSNVCRPSQGLAEDVDVLPFLICTEKDLDSELEEIALVLKDTKHNWQVNDDSLPNIASIITALILVIIILTMLSQERIVALKRLQSLALGPARRLPSFLPQLRRCAPGLIVQAHELRSAVSKVAPSLH